jgi:fructosamine-3-kinase
VSVSEALIAEALELAGDTTQLRGWAPVGGGSISQAVRLHTERGDYLLKSGGRGLPGFFAAEAHGLGLLAGTGAVRVPNVLAYRDAVPAGSGLGLQASQTVQASAGGFILLEWLAAPPHADSDRAAMVLGHQLAALHRTTASAYGLDYNNYLGATPQPNGWMPSWREFFRERRLRFQVELAQRNGRLTAERARRIELLLERLDTWIDDRIVQPALLHGDLWSGNYIIGPGGTPALIDPAAYYGDREADLAFTTLFGGFPQSFYQAYDEAWPLPAGWPERRDLYNLYHLLNHLHLFGEAYGPRVDQTLKRYTSS